MITDIDTASGEGHHKSQCPERSKKLISSNYAITSWLLNEKSLDILLDLSTNKKAKKYNTPYDYSIGIAYQTPQKISFNLKDFEAISSTFEDSLIYANLEFFKNHKGDGIFGTAYRVINNSKTFEELHSTLYKELKEAGSGKAGFALDLLYEIDPGKLIVPPYIIEGLNWLQEQLKQHSTNR